MAYSITLSDGTRISGLGLNGDNFISTDEVKPGDFAGKLSHVKIESDSEDYSGLVGEHGAMELVQVMHYEDGYYFILRDVSSEELERVGMRADLEYVAMMLGVEI